jgi:hypothetical protein
MRSSGLVFAEPTAAILALRASLLIRFAMLEIPFESSSGALQVHWHLAPWPSKGWAGNSAGTATRRPGISPTSALSPIPGTRAQSPGGSEGSVDRIEVWLALPRPHEICCPGRL